MARVLIPSVSSYFATTRFSSRPWAWTSDMMTYRPYSDFTAQSKNASALMSANVRRSRNLGF